MSEDLANRLVAAYALLDQIERGRYDSQPSETKTRVAQARILEAAGLFDQVDEILDPIQPPAERAKAWAHVLAIELRFGDADRVAVLLERAEADRAALDALDLEQTAKGSYGAALTAGYHFLDLQEEAAACDAAYRQYRTGFGETLVTHMLWMHDYDGALAALQADGHETSERLQLQRAQHVAATAPQDEAAAEFLAIVKNHTHLRDELVRAALRGERLPRGGPMPSRDLVVQASYWLVTHGRVDALLAVWPEFTERDPFGDNAMMMVARLLAQDGQSSAEIGVRLIEHSGQTEFAGQIYTAAGQSEVFHDAAVQYARDKQEAGADTHRINCIATRFSSEGFRDVAMEVWSLIAEEARGIAHHPDIRQYERTPDQLPPIVRPEQPLTLLDARFPPYAHQPHYPRVVESIRSADLDTIRQHMPLPRYSGHVLPFVAEVLIGAGREDDAVALIQWVINLETELSPEQAAAEEAVRREGRPLNKGETLLGLLIAAGARDEAIAFGERAIRQQFAMPGRADRPGVLNWRTERGVATAWAGQLLLADRFDELLPLAVELRESVGSLFLSVGKDVLREAGEPLTSYRAAPYSPVVSDERMESVKIMQRYFTE